MSGSQDKSIIMLDSPEAAEPGTMNGWYARGGYFYFDERSARFAGCTHRPCETCGKPVVKSYIYCPECRAKRDADRYNALPTAPWDGIQMVYSEARDEYYASPDEAEDELEEGEDIATLRLVLCDPVYAHYLDLEDFDNELPEMGEAPNALLDAIDAFTAAMDGVVLSWYPGTNMLAP